MSFEAVLAAARAEGRTLLNEVEAKDVLREAGVPVTNTTLAKNSAEAQSQAVTAPAVGSHVARIGGPTVNSSFSGNFQGRIDEVQVSTTDRSAEWVATSYSNQRAPGMFTLVGPEEPL